MDRRCDHEFQEAWIIFRKFSKEGSDISKATERLISERERQRNAKCDDSPLRTDRNTFHNESERLMPFNSQYNLLECACCAISCIGNSWTKSLSIFLSRGWNYWKVRVSMNWKYVIPGIIKNRFDSHYMCESIRTPFCTFHFLFKGKNFLANENYRFWYLLIKSKISF